MSTVTINRYLGSCSVGDCGLPSGAIVLEPKYCEICGRFFARPFAPTEPIAVVEREVGMGFAGRPSYGEEYTVIRRRDHGERFCRDCRSRQLQPDLKAQEQYKAQLPDEHQAKHNRVYQMPRYDKPPVGRQTQAHAISQTNPDRKQRKQCSREEARAWQANVRILLQQPSGATLERLQDAVPRCWTPNDAYSRIVLAGIKLVRIGDAPRRSVHGRPPALYALAPETIQ